MSFELRLSGRVQDIVAQTLPEPVTDPGSPQEEVLALFEAAQ
ncbi:MAG: hypothetical protein QM604_02795 [Microbacterium sp.]